MLCHPFDHLAHEPTWGGVRLARSGDTFREHAWHVPGVRMLDVPGSTGSIGSFRDGEWIEQAVCIVVVTHGF